MQSSLFAKKVWIWKCCVPNFWWCWSFISCLQCCLSNSSSWLKFTTTTENTWTGFFPTYLSTYCTTYEFHLSLGVISGGKKSSPFCINKSFLWQPHQLPPPLHLQLSQPQQPLQAVQLWCPKHCQVLGDQTKNQVPLQQLL